MGVAEVSRCECLIYVSVAQTRVLVYVQSFLLVREALDVSLGSKGHFSRLINGPHTVGAGCGSASLHGEECV